MRPLLTAALLLFTSHAIASDIACELLPETAVQTFVGSPDSFTKSGRHGLDANGVLIFHYGKSYENLGDWHNPYFISNYANVLYRSYLESNCQDSEMLRRFMLQADWLASSAEMDGGMAVWRYPFPNSHFDLSTGWISGIGQSRIAGVLLRAAAITGDDSYRVLARKAIEVYKRPLKEGGVITNEGDATWIEEAPDPNGRSYKILNGHITGLLGVKDLADLTSDPYWTALFDRGLSAIRTDIAQFDAGWTSFYSIDAPGGKFIAPLGGYNSLHVDQLHTLYEITGDPFFEHWSKRFAGYEVMQKTDVYATDLIEDAQYGPENLGGSLKGGWVRRTFPAWVTVTSGNVETFNRFVVISGSDERSPSRFRIEARMRDGGWKLLASVEDNAMSDVTVSFPPVETDMLRLTIEAPGNAGWTSIKAAVPVRYGAVPTSPD